MLTFVTPTLLAGDRLDRVADVGEGDGIGHQTHICLYIYIYMCVCVCACVQRREGKRKKRRKYGAVEMDRVSRTGIHTEALPRVNNRNEGR